MEPVNDDTYFECLDTVSRESRDLAESMPVISDSIKAADYNKFDTTVRKASDAVCALTESAAQVSNRCNCFFFFYSSKLRFTFRNRFQQNTIVIYYQYQNALRL